MGRDLKKAIREQKLELERLLAEKMLDRAPMDKVDVTSRLAQAIVGMRRSGKSVVCRMAMKNSGVVYGYVDFDDEVLAKIDASELDDVLQVVYEVYGNVDHFLFDEIQNVEGWHLFVNRLLRGGKHVVITGSNVRLLTGDLATHLTGRHIPISVFPFSYAEYCAWIGHETEDDWKRYFFNGGLPETFALADQRGYVSALYNSILSRDILGRRKVRNAQRFIDAAYVLMQQFSREISYDRLAQKAGVSSAHTMQTYTGYLAEAFLVSLVRRYSAKPAERIRNEKLYVSDPAFISYFTGVLGSDEELGWRLENIVYLELLRRRTDDDAEIFYYKDQTSDIDFCRVRHGKIVQFIQVAYTIEGLKTRRREVAPLFSAARKTGCGNLLLVTDHERETISQDGFTIEVMPAREWLSDNNLREGV
jgi:predicted AAA+ superfamily ATPase